MKIISYDEKYRSGVIDLLALFWKTDRSASDEHFNLKYEKNPFTDKIAMALLIDTDDTVVGIRPLFYLPGADGIGVFQLSDAFISPKMRGKGMQQKMLGFLVEELNASNSPFRILALSSNPAAINSYKRFGMESFGNLTLWGRNEKRGLFFKGLHKKGLLPTDPLKISSEGNLGNGLQYSTPENFIRKTLSIRTEKGIFDRLLSDPSFWSWRNGMPDYPLKAIYCEDSPKDFIICRVYSGRELRVIHSCGDVKGILTKLMQSRFGRVRTLQYEGVPNNPVFSCGLFHPLTKNSLYKREVLQLPGTAVQGITELPSEALFDNFF